MLPLYCTAVNRTRGFWAWYERHYAANLAISTALFALQLVHLYWLATHVIALRLIGENFFMVTPFMQTVIVLVDYTEIPALVSTTLLYAYHLRRRFSWKPIFFLVFLNSQWLHLFWITDEFVLDQFQGRPTETVLPLWLAWVAILIDYLEVPIIIDTFVKLGVLLAKGNVRGALEVVRKKA